LDITHVISDILCKYMYVVLYMCVIELLFGFLTSYNLLYPNMSSVFGLLLFAVSETSQVMGMCSLNSQWLCTSD